MKDAKRLITLNNLTITSKRLLAYRRFTLISSYPI